MYEVNVCTVHIFSHHIHCNTLYSNCALPSTHMSMWILLLARLNILSIWWALVFIARTKFSVTFKIYPFIDNVNAYSSRWPTGLLSLILPAGKAFRVCSCRFTQGSRSCMMLLCNIATLSLDLCFSVFTVEALSWSWCQIASLWFTVGSSGSCAGPCPGQPVWGVWWLRDGFVSTAWLLVCLRTWLHNATIVSYM